MNDNLFESFQSTSKEEWIELLKKELKGLSFEENLIKHNEIEDLTYPSFFHQDDTQIKAEVPGEYPYKRGASAELNDWGIVSQIEVVDEKQANEKALKMLMAGTSVIVFNLASTIDFALEVILKDLEIAYVKIYFQIQKLEQFQQIENYLKDKKYLEVCCLWNPIAQHEIESQIYARTVNNGASLLRVFDVDSYNIQQAGANITQEMAFALSLGHEYLQRQMKAGTTIDDALVNLHFTMGIGSNYILEIAKFRAFRMLWAKIARAYAPEHRCNELLTITAKTGFLNKSLRDPYTNLLRLTTEAMSAVLGGANQIWIQAYDKQSNAGESEFTQRMSTNISLILKEESYLEKVLDAVGGSYAIEQLTEMLATKAWKAFQEMEGEEAFSEVNKTTKKWKQEIQKTAKLRVELLNNKKKTLIGVNRYPSPKEESNQWQNKEEKYFGISNLVLEQALLEHVNKGN